MGEKIDPAEHERQARGMLVDKFVEFARDRITPSTFVEVDLRHNSAAELTVREIIRKARKVGVHEGHVVGISVSGRDSVEYRAAQSDFSQWQRDVYFPSLSLAIEAIDPKWAPYAPMAAGSFHSIKGEYRRRRDAIAQQFPPFDNLIIRKTNGSYIEVVAGGWEYRGGRRTEREMISQVGPTGIVSIEQVPERVDVITQGLGVGPHSDILEAGFPYVSDWEQGNAAYGRHFHVEPVILGQIEVAGLGDQFSAFLQADQLPVA